MPGSKIIQNKIFFSALQYFFNQMDSHLEFFCVNYNYFYFKKPSIFCFNVRDVC